jgi:hypothetical protein
MDIMTTLGPIPEEMLRKKTEVFKSEDAITTATEYWVDAELVHRSVNIELIGRDLTPVQQPLGA